MLAEQLTFQCWDSSRKNCKNTSTHSQEEFKTAHIPPNQKKFGLDAQAPLMPGATPVLDAGGIKRIQKIVGSILYYARAVNMTVLMALSSIAVEQTKAMEKTMGRCIQLLDYLTRNSEAKARYHAMDVIMNIHSDVSYLSKTKVHSRACGHFFMGWMLKNGQPIKLNGAFYVNTTISWWHQLRKRNLKLFSTIAKME
jgi:hypothetical protein